MPDIVIPDINPLHLTLEGYTPPPQYRSRNIRDYQFEDTIRSFETPVFYAQPWQMNDPIRLQIHSPIGFVRATVYDEFDAPIFGQDFAQIKPSFFDPSLFVYELDMDLSIFAEGLYRMRITFGSPIVATLVSNILYIKEEWKESSRIDYKHFKHYANVYFQSGFSPCIRIYNQLDYEEPGSVNTTFENQRANMTMINRKTFDVFRLYTGGPEGIPHVWISKYNIIMGCSYLNIDGILYTIATEGSKFTETKEKDYPMRGWSIELREKLNRTAKIITAEGAQNNLGLVVAVNVESKGFVANDYGGSFYEVKDVE